LARLAYFFDFDYPDGRNPNDYIRDLRRAVDEWFMARSVKSEELPKLDAFTTTDGDMLITDTRPCAVKTEYRLSGTAAAVYRECDAAQTIKQLMQRLGDSATAAELQSILEEFQTNKLAIEMDGRHLSLAVIRNRAVQHTKTFSHVDISASKTAITESLLHPL
jgi:hypothetical protein